LKRYINIEIDKKDCKGIYLYANSELKKITKAKDADALIDINYTLQLRTKIDGRTGKKNFPFAKKSTTFIKALDYVASQRISIRKELEENKTLRKQKEKKEEITQTTFIERVDSFLETKSISARHSTIQNYETTLRTHSKPLHDKEFETITIEDVQKIVNELIKTRANATIVLYARTLKVFLKELNLNWSDLELPEIDNKVEYTLSFADTKKIIQGIREYSKIEVNGEIFYQYEELKNIFAFSLTGRRIGEILSLKFSDFNFENNTYTLSQSNVKGKKELTFNLDEYLIDGIYSQARLRNIDINKRPDSKVFTYTRETPRVHFQNLLKALKLPKLRLHDIRHMLGTTLYQNGVPIQDISRMLGHSSITVTEQRYAKTTKEQASNTTNSFNKLMK
jgi:integrase